MRRPGPSTFADHNRLLRWCFQIYIFHNFAMKRSLDKPGKLNLLDANKLVKVRKKFIWKSKGQRISSPHFRFCGDAEIVSALKKRREITLN